MNKEKIIKIEIKQIKQIMNNIAEATVKIMEASSQLNKELKINQLTKESEYFLISTGEINFFAGNIDMYLIEMKNLIEGEKK